MGERTQNAEIAFFGGSFTAIDRDYMLQLLEVAAKYRMVFSGIRVSTRPDYIDAEVLSTLKAYGVTSVELGAQSMSDEVLLLNERGHTADDVRKAAALIQECGFSLGLQMMTGLYGSDVRKDLYTAHEILLLRPDTVRIYPTVVMKQTKLEQYLLCGKYQPYPLSQSVELCADLIQIFERAAIRVIRAGLHYTDSLAENGYCDNYHPAFRELCESRIFCQCFEKQIKTVDSKRIDVTINSKSLSKFLGQRKSNWNKWQEEGYEIHLFFDDTLGKYELRTEVSV